MDNEQRIKIAKEAVAKALYDDGTIAYTKVNRLEDSFPTPICWSVVGSTYIQDSESSDIDILVLVDENPTDAGVDFPGWAYGGSFNQGMPDCWESWKKNIYKDGEFVCEVNMILVGSRDYYSRWLDAASACRYLHLYGLKLTRGAIHGLHAVLMDDIDPEEEVKNRNY